MAPFLWPCLQQTSLYNIQMSAPARKQANPTRAKFVEMTARLMSRRGYAGVGLNEIVEKSGAPKGSLYYHFPKGKEQLAAEAVAWAVERFATTLQEEFAAAASPAEAIGSLAEKIAGWMEASAFKDGSPITIVAVETGAFIEPLRLACDGGFRHWTDLLAEELRRAGKAPDEAADLAIWAVASLEGACILARTQHSAAPLRRIGRLLQRNFE